MYYGYYLIHTRGFRKIFTHDPDVKSLEKEFRVEVYKKYRLEYQPLWMSWALFDKVVKDTSHWDLLSTIYMVYHLDRTS